MNHIWILLVQSILTLLGCVCLWIAYNDLGSNKWLSAAAILLFGIGILSYFRNDTLSFTRKGTRRIRIEHDRKGRDEQDRILFENTSDAVSLTFPDHMIDRRLYSAVQDSPIPTFVINERHQVLLWNKALEGLSGIKVEEVVGTRNHWKAFHPERRPCLADLLVSGSIAMISTWYGRCEGSKLLEGAYETSGFSPVVRNKWLRGTAAAIRGSRGELIGAVETIEDETDLYTTSQALTSANQQLNDVIDFLPDSTFVVDRDMRIIAWNRAMEEMTGVGKQEVIGRKSDECCALFYGEQRKSLIDLLDGPDKQLESKYHYVKQKGSNLCAETFAPQVYGGRGAYILAVAAPLFDVDGNRTGSIETVRDTSELKRKEEALRESRQQLVNIINFLPDPTFVIDREGKVIAWNKAVEEMTGVRAADILGKGDYEYAIPFYGKKRPILVDLVFDPHEDAEAQYVRIDRKDTVLCGEAYMPALGGGEVYLVGTASVLRDSKGNITGAIESIRDVTDRRHMEEALVLAERNYRGIFENAIMGIFQVSPEGRLIGANPACAGILGYDSPEELIESIRDVREIFREPESYVELVGLLRQSQVVREFEVQVLRKNDSTAWLILSARIIRDNKGRIAGIEGNVEDITNRKTLESILIQSQKLEAIGTLARGIAHDFNNILFPIIGFAEMSMQMVQEGSSLHHFLKQILLSANRAKGLVRQILTFSRKTDRELKPVQVSLLVKETIKLVRSSFPSTIEIQQRIDPDMHTVTVLSDPSQIHQVLLNLYTNAAHAMREKGGILRIALAGAYVEANDRGWQKDLKEGPYLQLTVSDTGHGMDETVKRRIFDPYFTTKGSEGTGLGLAVVYGIVKSLRGAISVFSEPDQGATFHVLLPMCADPESLPAEDDAPLPGGEGNILVVDDEEILVGMLMMMLSRLGYEVTARVRSADALEVFKSRPETYDLVITDQTMPHMTGIELAGEILKIRKDTPIILCSGFAEEIDESAAKTAGIKECIAKPVAFRQLAETISKILNPTSNGN